ncbi:hypothetical protein [Kosakonia oryzendophytica]|nr:hypothetical protein [Kosakonia oryzendophytica]WBT57342.1 hypothetical protein O9K67_19690 [Kosakonia oryzendophytica]
MYRFDLASYYGVNLHAGGVDVEGKRLGVALANESHTRYAHPNGKQQ